MTWYPDLRSYLEALDAVGDLEHVTREVDWDLEAAAATRLSYERREPAPLFENVTGCGEGFRLLGAPAALSSVPGKPYMRIALSLGLAADATPAEIVEHLARARKRPLVPPRVVPADQAPCKQNILLGDDATLDRFPIPRIHQDDGGRYANTWGVIVARTPDGRWTNWSIARMQMLDGKHLTGLVIPQQHLGMIWGEWAAIGEPMPFALAQGGVPAIPVIGGAALPAGVDEAAYLGALSGEPLDVVRCETIDLEVPATAEIVIEGHLSVTRHVTEGPFAEIHGYAFDDTTLEPEYTVEAITHRDDPIWPFVVPGRPIDETHTVCGPGTSAEALTLLRDAGLPITTAWQPLNGATHILVVTAPQDWRETLPEVSTAEFAHRVGAVLRANRVGPLCPVTYLLDDDIDPSVDGDLIWALGTRVHPTSRKKEWPGTVLPWYSNYTDDERVTGHGSLVVHDGLMPARGGRYVSPATFADAYPEAIRNKVLAAGD
ncbi:UbiD family decarboxylase [Streptomyces sp. NPDC005373]|uniref:UbiD family decarboxylase n=1 Tax=Streptomyces sp. NPDC005373 TaxID=3156879 RepID=UPI0033A149D7